ncbi:MAG: NAD(P)H-dependent oxidoreductase, partial [Spirochaetia bacterium]|nr:NAD(P)H-dependent oxidoreductase [Spirochaetia bacterium]
PESFKPYAEAILNADGLVIVTPEYNGSMPGILKYFIDLLKFPESFEHKPVAFIGLGGRFGALRPVEHLMQVFSYRNAHLFPERVFISEIKKQMSANGELANDDIRSRLEGQSAHFVDYVRHLRKI